MLFYFCALKGLNLWDGVLTGCRRDRVLIDRRIVMIGDGERGMVVVMVEDGRYD